MRTSGKLTNLIRYSLAFVFLFPRHAHKAVKMLECTTARNQATSDLCIEEKVDCVNAFEAVDAYVTRISSHHLVS